MAKSIQTPSGEKVFARSLPVKLDESVIKHYRAVRRLWRMYRRLKTWRAVAGALGCNQKYVYDLAVNDVEPSNPIIRKLFRLSVKVKDGHVLPDYVIRGADFLAERLEAMRAAALQRSDSPPAPLTHYEPE